MEQDFIEFEWDPEKAIVNIRKHGVTFREAAMVFNDTLAITYYDDAHSDYEPRFVTLGISDKGRVLVVCHTLIGEAIRLITARKATRHETNFYEKENKKTRRGR
jgi:uncharacterized DUF497 family protein